MVNGVHTDRDLYVPRSEEEIVKPSHSSVTETWISNVTAAVQRSEIETNDVISVG